MATTQELLDRLKPLSFEQQDNVAAKSFEDIKKIQKEVVPQAQGQALEIQIIGHIDDATSKS